MARRVAAVAHRGAPHVARENTLAAFRAALAAGADAVELDVRLTRDGVPVVLHDRTLERLWECPEAVAALSARELRARTGGGVPTLAEALELLRPVRVLIDLPAVEAVAATLAVVAGQGAAGRVYYCGGPAAMRAVRAGDPAAEIALTWQRTAPMRGSLLDSVRPRWLNYRFGVLDRERVRRAHAAGYLVSAWTVDRPRTMRRLAAMGVDALTSNRVAALRRTLPG
ncbi:glycerophosphodiester phosphodiesterase [Streptomyces sp. AJS327]|uniref:glycerophosphodiester phosphodiesterase n=1 Tax=Streptomyces sp. AJS327 TaxID=2545265 RepID=UPI0015DFB615|nr:glycerophosphodiester phosphodiesterase [Streptomyces sp. AJS327]MBA0051840.1 glycerophosphodiester phosphodiesterase [Streptomyces sp. AJS327]